MKNLFIIARSLDQRLLDDSVQTVIQTAKKFNVSVQGPVPLPTRNSRDMYADSTRRTCVFGRALYLVDPTQKLIQGLKNTKVSTNVWFVMKQED